MCIGIRIMGNLLNPESHGEDEDPDTKGKKTADNAPKKCRKPVFRSRPSCLGTASGPETALAPENILKKKKLKC